MIKSLSVLAVGLSTALVAAAAPASAAPLAVAAKVQQAGYVAVPKAFHSAAVTVQVPSLRCTKKSPQRTVSTGLFASETQAGVVRPFSLTVDATCKGGTVSYRAAYRNRGGGGLRVHPRDIVRLTLDGVGSYDIEDRTTGAGTGGGEGSPGGSQPKAERPVLIGVQWVGTRPAGVHVDLSKPLVNRTQLAKLSHHKRGSTATSRVSKLSGQKFRITFAS